MYSLIFLTYDITYIITNSFIYLFKLYIFYFNSNLFIVAIVRSQGISAKNVTLGVPRLNEILNVAKNIKTPSVTINIHRADDEEEASDLISQV